MARRHRSKMAVDQAVRSKISDLGLAMQDSSDFKIPLSWDYDSQYIHTFIDRT
jgi:hypothetical protein